MDALTNSLVAIRQADVQTRVDYAVAKKMLESEQASGQAAVKMIEAAAKSQASMVAAVSGLGACLDCQG